MLVLCGVLLLTMVVHAARLTIYIDGDNRKAYDSSRGKVGPTEWTRAVAARKGVILTTVLRPETACPVGHVVLCGHNVVT